MFFNNQAETDANFQLLQSKINAINNEKQVHFEKFKEHDFIFLRPIYSNPKYTYHLAIHIESLYIFLIKKKLFVDADDKEFNREVFFCENYKHRCLVKFYGFLNEQKEKKEEEIAGFVYEYMSNDSLSSYVSKHPERINDIFSLMTVNRIFQGMVYLHSNSLIHRDLKPLNILLDHDFIPYISDFETIRTVFNEELLNSDEEMTNDFGSQYYTPPEQDLGVILSFPADIYSFGLIIYFLFEKKNMLQANSSIYSKFVDGPVPPMKNGSEIIQNLYLNCVKNNPLKRLKEEEIKDLIIQEIESFLNLEKYLLDDKIKFNLMEIIQYFYENIMLQNDNLKQFDNCFENMYYFQFLFFSKLAGGSSAFLFCLGFLYEKGKFVKQDYSKAIKFYESAAKYDNSDALNNLGYFYLKGHGVKQDYKKAKEYFELSAKQNNSESYLNLGNLFFYGHGVKPDYLKAKEYYEKSAKYNNAKACFHLGNLYFEGFGVQQDYLKAIKYYELSFRFGYFRALNSIGNLYYNGFGVKRDFSKAKELFELASKQNDPDSFFNLGNLYYNGYGVKQDHKKAKEYYELSAKQNNSSALYMLGDLYYNGFGVNQDFKKAKEYFELSAKLGDSNAYHMLGEFYFNGYEVQRDYTIAKEYYELSSQMNNSDAIIKLGYLYENGLGVKQDYLKAKEC